METFCIELAGVPVRIYCRYAENRAFLRAYLTDKAPAFTVAPSEDDLRRMQESFDGMDEAEGIPKHRRTDSFLENNAIHDLLAEKLVDHDVLLMHGSALCMDGQGIIFTAKSGTGKSTHARLWREVFGDRVWMVNDDKPLLRMEDRAVTVWGTPWDGKHHLSRNAAAPLRAIVNLTRAEENRIEPMSKADAFPVLLRQCFSTRDPAIMGKIIALEKRLLDAVDFYTLGCNMERSAAQVAWEGMNAGISQKNGLTIN